MNYKNVMKIFSEWKIKLFPIAVNLTIVMYTAYAIMRNVSVKKDGPITIVQ